MSKGKKLFGIFNVIDLIIIAVVIVAIVFALIKIKGNKAQTITGVAQDETETYLEIYVEEANDFIVGHILEGDPVKDSLQNVDIGTVVKVEYGEPMDFNADASGRMVTGHKEGYVSCRVLAKTNGKLTRSGLTVNSYTYYVNKSCEVRCGNVALYGRISDLKEVKKEKTEVTETEEVSEANEDVAA